MKQLLKKLHYMISQRYHPYPMFWYDLLTEHHIKNRTGECVDCIECCRYTCGWYCEHANLETKRCDIYDKRKCYVWFPVSQKDIDYMAECKPGFRCKFKFENKKNENKSTSVS